MEKLYTLDEVAEILGTVTETIRRYVRAGKLKASKLGKSWRVSESSLKEFLQKNQNIGDEDTANDK